MVTSVVRLRHPVPAFVFALACACLGALFIVGASAIAKPASQSVLAVHDEGSYDTLWVITPGDDDATRVARLPGHAGTVAVAPGGAPVAYLPRSGSARVWIRYGGAGPRTISLRSLGVKKVHSLTWISETKLLVSGTKTGRQPNPYKDRLYVVDTATGKVASFRNLRGTEPSAALDVGKVAYVNMKTVAPAIRRKGIGPKIQESLKVLSLSGKYGGKTIDSVTYRLDTDQREFADPRLSPDANWVLYEETGSDGYVKYTVRDTGKLDEPILNIGVACIWAEAGWDSDGERVAFSGKLWTETAYQACVWAYDVETGALTRTPRDLLPETVLASMSWSDDGYLLAEADDYETGVQRIVAMPGDDLSSITDLGEGSLPVWVTRML